MGKLQKFLSDEMSDEQLDKFKTNVKIEQVELINETNKQKEKTFQANTDKDFVKEYLAVEGKNKLLSNIAKDLSWDDNIYNGNSKIKQSLFLWEEKKKRGEKITEEFEQELYDTLFDQSSFFSIRPSGENVDGETGEESDKKHAKEMFNAIMVLNNHYNANVESTTKSLEQKQGNSIITNLTDGKNSLIYSDVDGVLVTDKKGNKTIVTDEKFKEVEKEKVDASIDLLTKTYAPINKARQDLIDRGYDVAYSQPETDRNEDGSVNFNIPTFEVESITHDDGRKIDMDDESILLLQKGIEQYQGTYEIVTQEFESMHNASIARQEDNLTLSKIQSEEFIEKDYVTNFGRRFGSGVDNVIISIPALFGNESAKQKLQMNTDGARFQKSYTWDNSPWYQNTGMVFADQGANMLFFIGTMGAGSTVGLGNNVAMGVAAGGVGLMSGGQKRVQLETQEDNAERAKLNLANLDMAHTQGLVSDDLYKETHKNLESTIQLGKMTTAQKWGSITSTAVIEGGLTYAFGNVGSLKTAKNLTKMFSTTRATAGGAMNYNAATGIKETLYGIGKGLVGENIEEVSIYLATEGVDAKLFNKEMDYSQIGKVMIDASIMSGGSNSLSLTYGAVANHSMKAEMAKEYNDTYKSIKADKDRLAQLNLDIVKTQKDKSLTKKEKKKKVKELESQKPALEIAIENNTKKNILDWGNYQVQLLGLDEDTHKKIFESHKNLQNSYLPALTDDGNFDPSILNNPEALEQKLNNYKDKLNSEKRGSGDSWMDGITVLRENLETNQDNWNVDNATSSMYGEDHKETGARKKLQDRLNSKKNTKTKEGKARAEEHAKADDQNKLRIELAFAHEMNIEHAISDMQSNDKMRNSVEFSVFSPRGEDGLILKDENGKEILLNKEQWLEANGKKRITTKQKQLLDAYYNNLANTHYASGGRAASDLSQGGKNAKQVIEQIEKITERKLQFDEVGSFDGLINKVNELFDNGDIKKNEKASLIKTLEQNKEQIEENSNGFLLGNKFFVINKENVQQRIKEESTENQALIGAVHMHETGHYLDNSTKTVEEISQKGVFINEFLLNDKNKRSQEVNALAQKRLSQMSDSEGDYLQDGETIEGLAKERGTANEERSSRIDTVLDEYIREVTTILGDDNFTSLRNEITEKGRGF